LADPATKKTRIAAYRWNGFGFTGIETPSECEPILRQFSHWLLFPHPSFFAWNPHFFPPCEERPGGADSHE